MKRQLGQSIPAVLAEHEPLTAPEIASILDVHPVAVQRYCQRLQRDGRIRQVTGGAYVCSEDLRSDEYSIPDHAASD